MIEYYLLEELVTFARVGTLAKTADTLGLTQPAVTHSMQKLEDQLGVKLFQRQPNKIYLTETGKYTARQAKLLLDDNLNFTKKVRQFEQNQVIITFAADAPGPLIVLRSLNNKQVRIKDDLNQNNLESLLAEGQITCFLTNHPLKMRDIASIYLGTEKMSVNLPKQSDLAKQKEISFSDLKGKTLISPSNIGFWQQIYENEIPDAKIIYQSRSHEYSEILNFSILPYFTTNVTVYDKNFGLHLPGNRIMIPIKDEIAHQKFYACFLRQNEKRLAPLIEKIQDQWAKID